MVQSNKLTFSIFSAVNLPISYPASSFIDPHSQMAFDGPGLEQKSTDSVASLPRSTATSLSTACLNTCGAPVNDHKKRILSKHKAIRYNVWLSKLTVLACVRCIYSSSFSLHCFTFHHCLQQLNVNRIFHYAKF